MKIIQSIRSCEGYRLARRACLVLASLAIATTVTFHASPAWANEQPANTFVLLLSGPYKPVSTGPDLGLPGVNLNSGTYVTTKIYPVLGLPTEDSDQVSTAYPHHDFGGATEGAIGKFYYDTKTGAIAAYKLPEGTIEMQFTGSNLVSYSDGEGGTFLVGDISLNITAATGIYASFVGGHNHMVDMLHILADGTQVEHCYCIISRPT